MDYENQQQAAQGGSQQQTMQQYYEQRFVQIMQRVGVLEQQVANQALALRKIGDLNTALQTNVALKSQAAQAQGSNYMQEQLDAKPLRSDTKPLLEMAAFVRKVAWVDFRVLGDGELVREFVDTIIEAREILKRST